MHSQSAPLAELQRLTDLSASGELICVTSHLEAHVYLQQGRVAWATSSSHPFEFSRFIRRSGKVDDETFRQVLAECRREKLPVGETLVAWGLVTMDDVKAALRHQIELVCSLLAAISAAQTMFLERKRFTEYNPELTVALGDVLPGATVAPLAVSTPTPAPVAMTPSRHDGPAQRVLNSVLGAQWVEVLEADRVVDAAPSGPRRVKSALVKHSVADEVDFAALRNGPTTLFGIKREGGSLWVG